jgi:hypothetical protein
MGTWPEGQGLGDSNDLFRSDDRDKSAVRMVGAALSRDC